MGAMTTLARTAIDAARGAALAIAAAALSYALALGAFRRAYYFGVLLPLALVLFLLVAWLIHLRLGGFMKSYRDEKAGAKAKEEDAPRSAQAGEPPLASLFAPRDERIVPRAEPIRERSPEEKDRSARRAARALAWGAAWLGLLAAALYRLAGIGAAYFLR
jgi:hypothetical protein